MSKRKVSVLILCEDRQQEVFVRHCLVERGVHPSKIRTNICPKGKQAGEQYVRERYPAEVRAHRSKASYLSISLAIVIDADTGTVQERLSQLDEALQGHPQPGRQIKELIAIFVPKRNIETWIHYLKGAPVDEDTVYQKLGCESDCKPLVDNLVRQCVKGLPTDAPASLHHACLELKRILP